MCQSSPFRPSFTSKEALYTDILHLIPPSPPGRIAGLCWQRCIEITVLRHCSVKPFLAIMFFLALPRSTYCNNQPLSPKRNIADGISSTLQHLEKLERCKFLLGGSPGFSPIAPPYSYTLLCLFRPCTLLTSSFTFCPCHFFCDQWAAALLPRLSSRFALSVFPSPRVSRLRAVTGKSRLYNDRPVEIQGLTEVIKEDISNLARYGVEWCSAPLTPHLRLKNHLHRSPLKELALLFRARAVPLASCKSMPRKTRARPGCRS